MGPAPMRRSSVRYGEARHNGCHSFCVVTSVEGRLRGPRS
jgi:hypothetical protein